MRSIPSIGKRKRTKYFKILSIAAVILCLMSLLLPWIRYEVKTDEGVINLSITREYVEDFRRKAFIKLEDVSRDSSRLHLKKSVEACIKIYETVIGNQLTPVEAASDFVYARTAIKGLEAAAKNALIEEFGYPESMVTSDLIDSNLQDSLGLDAEISEMRTSVTASAVVIWLMIAILVGLGGYVIYATAADKKNLIWILTVYYGILLLACCIFVMKMNSLVRAELEGYGFLAEKSVSPLHIPIWPILVMACLTAAAVEEYALLQLGGKVAAVNSWICACGRKNRKSDAFCVSCGRMRGGAKTPPKPPKAYSNCRKCGRQVPMGEELCDRCRYGESTGYGGGASDGGEGSRVKIHFKPSSGRDDVPSGFTPPDGLG